MTEVIAATKATACVSDRMHVSFPAETAVVYINDNEDGEGSVGWRRSPPRMKLKRNAAHWNWRTASFFVYTDDSNDLSIELERRARRLCFRFAKIIELTDDPVEYSITVL